MSLFDSAMKDIKDMDFLREWMDWVKINFPKAGAKSSLVHLQREIKETIEEIESDTPNYTQEEGVTLMEYADCILCLLSSASFSGFTSDQILSAIKNKANINMYKREWIENGDGTYSHKK